MAGGDPTGGDAEGPVGLPERENPEAGSVTLIISRTPLRISFFGGGTDYPAWYREEGGAVLSTSIDKYCYLSCRYLPPFFSAKHRIVWRHVEIVDAIAEILHPAVREGLRYLGYDDSTGVEIHYQGDLPARSGLGSSSTFAVGLIKALTALRGETLGQQDLALKAIEFEQNVLNDAVGSQDQVVAAYGGFNVIHFLQDGDIQVNPLDIPASRLSELESRLLLFYTGRSRFASKIAADIVANLPGRREVFRQMHSLVGEAASVASGDGDVDDFGRLLHETWMLKCQQSNLITNSVIDDTYQTARKHGALGGKLLGAGSSGFMIFFVPPERQPCVIEALSDCMHVPFKFETAGSSIIYDG